MTFVACGINHKTAPIEIREKISLSSEQQDILLRDLVQHPDIRGAMILTTCNRTEFYCDTDAPLLPWLTEKYAFPRDILDNHSYLHTEHEGIRHTMRVACGLDSMVLGEPQILGQMKQAYHKAREIGALNLPLQQIFRHVFNASKKVRTQTSIGAYPVSIAFTAVHLIRKVFPALQNARVLLIGSGDTATLVAKYLKNQGAKEFYVASRTLENAERLAEPLSGKSLTISQIPDFIAKADIVISATNCPLPFIGKDMVAHALTQRKSQYPLFLFDLAVPRDIESNVNELNNSLLAEPATAREIVGDSERRSGMYRPVHEHLSTESTYNLSAEVGLCKKASVFLYNIDDLQSLANEGLEERQLAAFSAEQIIETELNNYLLIERGKKANHVIREYRKYAKQVRLEELTRAKRLLGNGLSSEEILDEMSHRLLRKLLHRPSLQLKNAAFEERHDILEYIAHLYNT